MIKFLFQVAYELLYKKVFSKLRRNIVVRNKIELSMITGSFLLT